MGRRAVGMNRKKKKKLIEGHVIFLDFFYYYFCILLNCRFWLKIFEEGIFEVGFGFLITNANVG